MRVAQLRIELKLRVLETPVLTVTPLGNYHYYLPVGVTGISNVGCTCCSSHLGIGRSAGTLYSHTLVQHEVRTHIAPITTAKPNTTKIPVLFIRLIYSCKIHLYKL